MLAARLGARPVTRRREILEIGCGLALASLVDASARRRRDGERPSSAGGAFLAENLRLNGLAPMKYLHGDWDAARRGRANAAPRGRGRFDLIVGSDLLYERDASGAPAGFSSRHAQGIVRGLGRRPRP